MNNRKKPVKSSNSFHTFSEDLYRFCYEIGLHTAYIAQRVSRRAVRVTRPFRRHLLAIWRKTVTRRWRRFLRGWRDMAAAFPSAREQLRQARKKRFSAVFPCGLKLAKRAMRHYRDTVLALWSLIGPSLAAVVLLVTVGLWLKTDFCLAIHYRGYDLGHISGVTAYDTAAAQAKARVINVDNSFSVETAPQMAITVKTKGTEIVDDRLCDAILSTEGDSIAEATGLYINGAFVGAMESDEELKALLDGMKDGYYDKSDPNQRAEFVQDVKTVEGLYPASSVTSGVLLKNKLTSEAVVKKTYTVQPGDTLSRVALIHDMTISELRAMNPAFANTEIIHIGDVLTVQKPQSFLQVKVIKTIYYTEKIAFAVQTITNSSQPVTWSRVKTQGVEGSQDMTAEITYVDGQETGRKVVAKNVTKQPVAKVIEKGTKPVKNSSGGDIVIGDGKTIGNMVWPVPICHSMSRGFGRGHGGLDICNGPITVRNKPAIAADGGTVIFAGWYSGYGNFVKIQHANGLVTAYGHLNSIRVVKGQAVSRGQTIGLIGSTGRSSGPHLHFEVIKNGVRVNPLRYVKP